MKLMVFKQIKSNKGVCMMKAKKLNGIKFRSRSACARELLLNSNYTDMQIAKEVGITPQTVHAVKMKMMMTGKK